MEPGGDSVVDPASDGEHPAGDPQAPVLERVNNSSPPFEINSAEEPGGDSVVDPLKKNANEQVVVGKVSQDEGNSPKLENEESLLPLLANIDSNSKPRVANLLPPLDEGLNRSGPLSKINSAEEPGGEQPAGDSLAP